MVDVVHMREVERQPWTNIAYAMGVSTTTAQRRYKRAKAGQDVSNDALDSIPMSAYAPTTPAVGSLRNEALEALRSPYRDEDPEPVLDREVRPLAVPMPPQISVTPGSINGVITALLWGDTHFGSHDDDALGIVMQIAGELQPSLLCHMGDLLDCYKLSRFDKDPGRKDTLQDEINLARQHLASMRLTSPQSRFVLLEGNHEDRLRRALWNADDTANTVMRLTKVQEALTWPTLLGLDELGIEFVPYQQQSRRSFLPKFLLKHGTIVRTKSAYTAKAEQEKYGKSGASGHTHRLGMHYHNDSRGSHVWIETGCTCRLDPEYAQDPDWQNGCVVLTFEPDTGAVQVEPIHIDKGMAVWRGAIYRA